MEKKGIVVIKALEKMSDDSLLNVIGGEDLLLGEIFVDLFVIPCIVVHSL